MPDLPDRPRRCFRLSGAIETPAVETAPAPLPDEDFWRNLTREQLAATINRVVAEAQAPRGITVEPFPTITYPEHNLSQMAIVNGNFQAGRIASEIFDLKSIVAVAGPPLFAVPD